jgi:hypothetical protein
MVNSAPYPEPLLSLPRAGVWGVLPCSSSPCLVDCCRFLVGQSLPALRISATLTYMKWLTVQPFTRNSKVAAPSL